MSTTNFFSTGIGPQENIQWGTNESEITNDQTKFEVINLSTYPLTTEQIQVLSLGLPFCPTQKIDQFELIKNLNINLSKNKCKVIYNKNHSHT